MQAIEFITQMGNQHQITLPENYNHVFKEKERVRVIILREDTEEGIVGNQWKKAAEQGFLNGYEPGDSIYDTL